MHDDTAIPDRTARLQLAIAESHLPPGPPHPCAYLKSQIARNLAFTADRLPIGLYHALMDLNFRRSGTVIYRPDCPRCTQCQAIRLPVAEFRPDRTQRRCRQRNQSLTVEIGEPVPTDEKHALFRTYLARRHDGEMGEAWDDFCRFLYESPVESVEFTYRLRGRLLAVGIADVEPAAISTVYCYFDPAEPARSLGVFNVLATLDHCRRRSIPYLYLGYYIRDCAKMNYKTRYRPCEILQPDGRWQRVATDAHARCRPG